jgi:hypothetical protein
VCTAVVEEAAAPTAPLGWSRAPGTESAVDGLQSLSNLPIAKMGRHILVGIDPDLGGALALLRWQGPSYDSVETSIDVFDMPSTVVNVGKRTRRCAGACLRVTVRRRLCSLEPYTLDQGQGAGIGDNASGNRSDESIPVTGISKQALAEWLRSGGRACAGAEKGLDSILQQHSLPPMPRCSSLAAPA